MKRILQALVIIISLLHSLNVFAQSMEVKGSVIDEQGEPMIGASILIKGTSTGTVSDEDGNFTIHAAIGDIIVVSYVGFAPQEINLDDNLDTIEVKLKIKLIELDEVIICHNYPTYGCGPTGCPTNLNIWDNIILGNFHHPYQILRGRVPGLTIAQPGGDPLGFFDVQQRGAHSILGSTEPLIVVDGLPGASIQTIDPQDIESITVLRDPATASMYGTRGANGVISIQTKKSGFNKKLQLSYSGYASMENVTRRPDVLSAATFRRLANDASFPYSDPAYDLGNSTDWLDEITRTGVSQAHNLALAGRLENTGYRVALNYRDVNGVARNSGFDQANLLLHISQELFKSKLRLNAGGSFTQRNFTDVNKDIFYYAALMNPTAPVRNNSSQFGGYYHSQVFDLINPVALAEQVNDEGKQNIYTLHLGATWQILDQLNTNVHYSAQNQDYKRNYNMAENIFPNVLPIVNNRSEADLSNQFFEATLKYNYYKEKHDVNITGGYNYQTWINDLGATVNYDLMRLGLRYENVSFPTTKQAEPFAYKTAIDLAAFFGRLEYNYDGWLSASASLRREGSSRFGSNHRWGNFPAFGVGIDFAELAELDFANQLKLRASYGITGNLPVDGIYAGQIFRQQGTVYYNGQFIPSYGPGNNINPDLKWEERREFNLGLDFMILNGHLTGSVDYYRGQTNDIIYNYSVPVPPNFFNRYHENMIDFSNRGVEIVLRALPVQGAQFAWEIGVNFASDRTSIKAINPSQGEDFDDFIPFPYLGTGGCCFTELTEIQEDEALGRFIAWEVERVENGFPVQKDQNGDGFINAGDFIEIGNALPRFTYSISNTLRWRSFDLNFFLRGVAGHDLVNVHRLAFSNPVNFGRYNVHEDALASPRTPSSTPIDRRFVENASFLRLENLVLAYNFNVQKNALISRLKLYAAAQNLFTLTEYSGPDPEVRLNNRGGEFLFNPNPLVPGIDARMTYLPTRTFTLGVQAMF